MPPTADPASSPAHHIGIHHLFDRVAARSPDAVAIEDGARRLTYAELAAASRGFAAALRGVGVVPAATVGIAVGRCPEFVIAALGVLRCGAAYAPLPCDDPAERVAEMIRTAGIVHVAVPPGREEHVAGLRSVDGLVGVPIRGDRPPAAARGGGETVDPDVEPESAAAVMFTSGSTGTPKGVVVPHRAVVGLVTGQRYVDFAATPRLLMAAPTAFDASTFEVWGALLHGGTVVVYPDRHFDPHRFGEVVREGRVDCLWLTSGLFNQVVDHAPWALEGVGHVLTGGDVVSMAHVRRAFERLPSIRITNGYGPTETTTFACTHAIDRADTFPHGSVPLGRPLAHTTCLVCSDDGVPLPDGQIGELWIGGSGVALGYLSGPEGRFVSDPRPGRGGERMYRSGDLCRRLADGTILFHGRADRQVKIRGFRVEPAEIEAVLARHPSVRSAVVVTYDRGGERTIAGFVERSDGGTGAIEGLAGWLEGRLPAAMLPTRLIAVESLPLTPNGKPDRARLLSLLDRRDGAPAGPPPRPGTESTLATLWGEVVGVAEPARDDDFFTIGGSSLSAIRLVAAIESRFGVRLPVVGIFEARTLTRIAAAIDEAIPARGTRPPTPPREAGPYSGDRLLPALPAQRGMWALDAILRDRATYNQPWAFRATGPIDWAGIRRSLADAMRRHPALRLCLVGGPQGPLQRIQPPEAVALPWAEEAHVDAAGLAAALFHQSRVPFDLGTAPLWRATLFPAAAPHGVLLLTFHHAIIDDWSFELLVRELSDQGGPHRLDRTEERDAAAVAIDRACPAEIARSLDYWTDVLAGDAGGPRWPWQRGDDSAAEPATSGGMHRFRIEAALAEPLARLARRSAATRFQVLFAAFHAWLHRMTGADDVVVGTPVSLRRTTDSLRAINCFLNTLPLRIRWDGDRAREESFAECVIRVKRAFLDAVGHASVPFDEIVGACDRRRSSDGRPLVNTLFVALPGVVRKPDQRGVILEPLAVDTATAKFDLTLFLEGDDDDLAGAFEFDRRRFDEPTVAAFAASFSAFLGGVLVDPDGPVSRAALLDAGTRRGMIGRFGRADEPGAVDRSLWNRFQATVDRSPDAIAVRWDGGERTYRELHREALAVAARLRIAGVSADAPVAVCLARGPRFHAAIVGILAAGGCAVPLDPSLPVPRIVAMLSIARAGVVLADRSSAPVVEEAFATWPEGVAPPSVVAAPEGGWDMEAADASAIVEDDPEGRRLAYLLFTSGSTGVPKGVEMPVGPLANLVDWQCRHSGVGVGSPTLHFASVGFDVSFQEMWSTWASGGQLVVVPDEARLDPTALLDLAIRRGVERLFLPVAVLEHVAEAALATGRFPDRLREVIVAGEQLRIGTAIRRFFGAIPGCILWNQYGPTESHVVTSHRLAGSPDSWPDLPPIGRPIAGASVLVLDPFMDPVPPGAAGEIWIGGACLARGYAGRPDLTAERFVVDPFFPEAGGRLYRTGDIGWWRPDGTLEYVGRADRQVKIRGHRVEPDEVEAVLASHPSLGAVAAGVERDDRGEASLVAWVSARPEAGVSPPEILAWAAARLPAAMVPSRVMVLADLPLTPNGKVDRRRLEALPDPRGPAIEPVPPMPLGQDERILAELWQEVLRRGPPAREDDFFRVGGTSLSAMRLAARARERLGIEVAVRDIFDHPRLADLAAHWLRRGESPLPDRLRPAGANGVGTVSILPPTPAQRGMWFLDAWLADRATYNQPFAFRADGPVDWELVRVALGASMTRHPALRTALRETDDGPVQLVHAPGAIDLPWRVVDGIGGGSLSDAILAEARRPFDLAVAPLWRATILPDASPHGILVLVFHHAIVDHWSIAMLGGELADWRQGTAPSGEAPSPVVRSPDAGRLAWLRDRWSEELSDAPPAVRLPGATGFEGAGGAGASIHRRIAGIAAGVVRVAEECGATVAQWLFATFHAWVHRVTGSADVIVVTPMSLRGGIASEDAFGCLVNTVPIRVRWDRLGGEVAGPPSLGDVVARVRSALIDALDWGDLPFDQIVAAARPVGALSDLLFVVTERGRSATRFGGAGLIPIPCDTATAKFGFTCFLDVVGDDIDLTVEYATAVYDERRAAILAEGLEAFLRDAVVRPKASVDALAAVGSAPGRPASACSAAAVGRRDADAHGPPGPPTPRHEVPRGPIESRLAEVWRRLLRVDEVGRGDDFFRLGGHSLLAMRLVADVDASFGVRLPVRCVFQAPRLSDLAALIRPESSSRVTSTAVFGPVPADDAVTECPALPAQLGMWLLHELLPDPASYNLAFAWRVEGPLDWGRLRRAFEAVARRHPALRTELRDGPDGLTQRILPAADFAIPWHEIRAADAGELGDLLVREARRPFDLSNAPLWRATRGEADGAETILMLSVHHAVFDEWSVGVLRDDLSAAYAADGAHRSCLPILTAAVGADHAADRAFWRETLAGAPLETALPQRQASGAAGAARVRSFILDGAAAASLRATAARDGVTIFALLLASCHAWLRRVTGADDVIVGTPVATRGAAGTAEAIGCLINVLPIRVRWAGMDDAAEITIGALAARIRETFLGSIDHASLAFHEIVAAAVPERRGSRQPLVNVLFTLVEEGEREWSIGPATVRPLPVASGRSRFDLSLMLVLGPDGIECTIEASDDVLEDDLLEAFVGRYRAFLAELAADPTLPLERLGMIPEGVRRLVLEEWNDTAVDLGGAVTLDRLVLEQADRTPGATALRDGERSLDYAGLAGASLGLARALRRRGIGPGMRVGIALPRSQEAVVSILAVLRTGAAWVPLDPGQPPARASFIVEDAGLSAIIESGGGGDRWPAGIPIVDPSESEPSDRLLDDPPDHDPSAAAYVMYTSGSTGRPKGVVIPHAAAVNYLRGKQRRFPLSPADVVLHSTGTTFDISLYEIFGPLLAGASLVVLPAGPADPARIAGLVRGAGVTIAQFVPSLLGLLVDEEDFTGAPTLRRVFCGGEALPASLMNAFLERATAEFVNVYGPTEATVWATAWVCRSGESAGPPPIGRPLDNVRCYVLDAGGRPVPPSVAGELWIGGRQLADGYHGLAGLSAARFAADPFSRDPGARMYRTGDVCRWREEGVLEFLGRADQQVKIRGHRVELGEIEACLEGHPAVERAVVVVAGQGVTAATAAFIVPRDGAVIDAPALRGWVAGRLPEVMVPSRVLVVADLPYNVNGKIDRTELTRAARSAAQAAPDGACPSADRPRSALESLVLAAWQRVLERVDVDPDDDFFAVGGHSLAALRLVASLAAAIGRPVPVSLVFEAPTVRGQAVRLESKDWRPRFDSLVPMQPLGSGPAVFFLHGVMGGVSSCLDIAHGLAPDIPVLGLQAIDLDGQHPRHPSAAAMVAHYAAEILAFQPRGPYLLAGFCAGGWLAYGVGAALRREGARVGVVLLDTGGNCRVPFGVWIRWMAGVVPELVFKHIGRLRRLAPAAWPRYILDRLLPAVGRLRTPGVGDGDPQARPPDPDAPYLPLIERLRVTRSDVEIVHVGAEGEAASNARLFRCLTLGSTSACRLPGKHHDVLRPPNAAAVAAMLRHFVTRLQRGAATRGASIDGVPEDGN